MTAHEAVKRLFGVGELSKTCKVTLRVTWVARPHRSYSVILVKPKSMSVIDEEGKSGFLTSESTLMVTDIVHNPRKRLLGTNIDIYLAQRDR